MNETKIIDGVVFQSFRIGSRSGMRRWIPQDYKWTVAGWTNNQLRFDAASKSVDSIFSSNDNKLRNEKISLLEKQARTGKAKPEIIFAWALAVLRGREVFLWDRVTANEKLRDASAFLSLSDNHKYFDYYRLRFLIESRAFPNKSHIIAGKKILNTSKKDIYVLHRLSVLMSLLGKNEEKKESLAISEKLSQSYPMSTTFCSHLGRVYRQIWVDTNDDSMRLKAISQYEKYMKISRPSNPWRKDCAQILKKLIAKER